MISDKSIKAILAATNLPVLIGEYVELTLHAGTLKGLCPFHSEKTPSFCVFDDHYHCFGCSRHGNAFEFLQEHLGLSFPECARMLAARAGLPLEESHGNARQIDSGEARLIDTLRRACATYQHLLFRPEGVEALASVSARGLDEDSIARFGVGFAPARWNTLTGDSSYDHKDLLGTGLATRRTNKPGCYDAFRNRLVFPIHNTSGQVVGFGGRMLGDGGPKYLNTEETALYRKGKILFGISQARNAIRKSGFVVVCEGFFDVITPAQHGFENIVSTCGTALTEEQIALLFSLSNTIVFCFDGDAAGSKATWRSAEMMVGKLSDQHEVRLCILPAQHDPDSFVRENGVDQFRNLVNDAPTLASYLADTITKGASVPESRARSLIKAKALWTRYGSPIQAFFFRQLICERLGLSLDQFDHLGSAPQCIADSNLEACPSCSTAPHLELTLDRWQIRCACGIQTRFCRDVEEARTIWNQRTAITINSSNKQIETAHALAA